MSAITAQDWVCRPGLPQGAAHVYRRAWTRTLCGMLVPGGVEWVAGSKRRQCKSCLRRLDNAKHWMHLLLERGP